MSSSLVPKRTPRDTASAEFQFLRAYVERKIPGRAVVLVTSAKGGDGKSLTAYSLADCLARAGRQTALVEAPCDPAEEIRLPNPDRQDESDATLAQRLPMPNSKTPLSREATARFVENMRSSHEYTIIDSAALLTSEMAMAFAEAVDGVLLSVRLGRAPSSEDELTTRMLDCSGSRVLGVVAAAPQAIAEFERRRATNRPADALTVMRRRSPNKTGAALTGAKRGLTWLRPVWRVLIGVAAAAALTLGAGAASSPAVSPPAAPAAAPLVAPAAGPAAGTSVRGKTGPAAN